jgi:hypothetical protein
MQDNSHESKQSRGGRSTGQSKEDNNKRTTRGFTPFLYLQAKWAQFWATAFTSGAAVGEGRGWNNKGGLRLEQCRVAAAQQLQGWQ